jgi:hypothetical protein
MEGCLHGFIIFVLLQAKIPWVHHCFLNKQHPTVSFEGCFLGFIVFVSLQAKLPWAHGRATPEPNNNSTSGRHNNPPPMPEGASRYNLHLPSEILWISV